MGVVLGEGSRSDRRTVSAAWEAEAQCDREHPEEHKQDPETTQRLPWDQRTLAKFGAIQNATQLSKVIPIRKGLSPRSQ